jgi:succinate dehydrogenase / fumarate reductase membrane anchor subunit
MSSKYYGSRGSGAPAWYLQRVSGVALFVVAIGHYILMHYHLDSGHTYDAVLARMQNPLYKALQISFVVLGLYHGLSGTWNIFRDYKMPAWLSWTILGLLYLAGISFASLGIATILSF